MTNTVAKVDKRAGRIDARTGRPDAAYPRQQTDAERYTEEFSRALKLKPTHTHFGQRKVKI